MLILHSTYSLSEYESPEIGRANICLRCTTSDAPTYSGVCDMLICRYNAYMQVQCGFDTYFSDTAIWALFWLLQQCQVVATIVARAHLYLIVYILVDIQHSLQHLTGEWCPFQKLLNFRDLQRTDSNLENLYGLGREGDARVFFAFIGLCTISKARLC